MSENQNMRFKFKRLWQDYRQYRLCCILFISVFIIILFFIKNITFDVLLVFLGYSILMFLILWLTAHSKMIHNGRDMDEIVMDSDGISLVRKNITIRKIRWEDIDKIDNGRWGLDFGYGFTYIIWDKNGDIIFIIVIIFNIFIIILNIFIFLVIFSSELFIKIFPFLYINLFCNR